MGDKGSERIRFRWPLYIRADGNKHIGTGHIMRCLAIAKAARELNGSCVFITADDQMTELIVQAGFECINLHGVWNDLEQETQKMERLIHKLHVQSLLVDSYYATPEYLGKLHQLTRVIYMGDRNEHLYPCSVLIDAGVESFSQDYPRRYPDTSLLLGPRYVLLREEFRNLPKRSIRHEVGDVLITTGGGDPLNMSERIVRAAKESLSLCEITYHVVVGRFNPHLSSLMALAQEYPGVVIYQNLERMSELMLRCDAAVSAGGTTLYELCACGTPTVCFSHADNQMEAAAILGGKCMVYTGDARGNPAEAVKAILEALRRLSCDAALREGVSVRMQDITDGEGARRVIESIMLQQCV